MATFTNYFAQRLGIPDAKLKVIPPPYHYNEQVRLFVLNEQVAIKELSIYEYVEFIVRTLSPILEQQKESTLVLFTSHDILQKVYYRMQMSFLENGREIIAQGIGGSREKLLKRFRHRKGAVLFGADSFWQGVDLPGDTLQLLIVTRLPFDHPQRPMIEAKSRYLDEQGDNYFKKEALPKASLKLRQGLGRLIRSEEDRGVMVVLDSRLIHSSYGQKLQQSLPKDLAIHERSVAEMLPEIAQFFKRDYPKEEIEADSPQHSVIIEPSKGVESGE